MILTPLDRRERKFYNLQTLSIFLEDNVLFVGSLKRNCEAENHYKIPVPLKNQFS